MSYDKTQRPLLGATFIPGGFDDYYMPAPPPEVVSPAPQRIMPEVPENMQENIAHLELEATEIHKSPAPLPPTPQAYELPSTNVQSAPPPPVHNQYNLEQQRVGANSTAPSFPPRESSLQGIQNGSANASQPPKPLPQPSQTQLAHRERSYSQISKPPDLPNFSPFPRLVNPPPNVPPTDDEKEATLEHARVPVLNSNDPEMQLAWAQDALAYVDASQLHEERLCQTQAARPATPQIEHQLRVDAMNIVQFLADQRHPKAEFMRGMWLEFGKFGMRVDKKEAFRCYSRAADRAYSRAEYRIGMLYESSNDPIKALQHYKRGSEANDSASNYRLGMMTLLGQHGQQQDYGKGIQLIRQAAANADENAPQGAYVLGMLQARELPQINIPEIYLPYDERQAKINIEKAAYLGFAKAELKMGTAYELCTLGCEFNPALSLHYNALAARQGEPEAEMAISKWFLCGYDGVFEKNEELAYVYAQRAATSGLHTAEFAIGYFNEVGVHIPVNLNKAMDWYQKAAKQGNKDAQSRIDGLQKSRALSKKDHEDVAISRIKSQYGSRRGVRPDRFKTPAPPLPTINDDAPGFSDAPPTTGPPSASSRLPPRGATTTPYPLEDKPPVVTPVTTYPERSATTAPYPLESGPPGVKSRPGPPGGFFAPESRSATTVPAEGRRNSAFNINPDIYTRPRPDQGPPGRMPYPQGGRGGPIRPNTTVNVMGRTSGALQGQQRVPSWGPQGYRQPGAPSVERPEPASGSPPGPRKEQRSETPRIDIGFSAPEDSRRRLQKPNPSIQRPATTVSDIGFEAPSPPRGPSGPKPPPKNQSPTQTRPGSAYPLQDRPATVQPTSGRQSARPGSSGRPGPVRRDSHPPKPQPQPPTPAQSQPQAPPQQQQQQQQQQKPAPPSAVPARPGKGPKTFEDMGIPQGKQENDCVVM